MARYSLFVLKVPLNTKQTSSAVESQSSRSCNYRIKCMLNNYCLQWFKVSLRQLEHVSICR